MIYVKKRENIITFKIKTGYYLELLTPEITKLLGSNKSKITKNENGENVPHLEITEVILIHCNIFNNDHQQDLIVLYTFVPYTSLLDILPINFIFQKLLTQNFNILKYGLLIKILNH